MLPQDLELRHLGVLVLVRVLVLPLHAPDLDELAALARRDEEPVAAVVEDVDGLVVVLARPAVSSRACRMKKTLRICWMITTYFNICSSKFSSYIRPSRTTT